MEKNKEETIKKIALVICLCGNMTEIKVIGKNNADGKALCKCGRHITVHFRKKI